jgi:hypothetical protein
MVVEAFLSRGRHRGGRFARRRSGASFSHIGPGVGLMPENAVEAC